MARRKAALKSLRKEGKKRVLNKSRRLFLKSIISRCKKLISANNPKAKEAFTLACSSLDKAAKKGLIPENRAARKKARLARLLGKIPPSTNHTDFSRNMRKD